MKTKQICQCISILSLLLFPLINQAADITATASGSWSDTNIWSSGTVPGANDDADIPAGINVTVDTNVTVQFIYDSGTVTMAPNSALNLTFDAAISPATTLITTATGNTVIYSANPFGAKQGNYYNLVFATTNYTDPFPPFVPWQDFNNFSSAAGPTPMTIAGNMTLMGSVKVQQGSGGAPITIGGNLIIGKGCAWDCSGDNLTVASNLFIYGLLEDLNGALGTNHFGGKVIVAGPGTHALNYNGGTYTNGWFVSDVTTWGVGGSLTNNGAIFGKGYGSIIFEGAGTITGTNALTLPTITVNGTYAVDTTITLTTNTPTLNGTLVFDIASTNRIVLPAYVGTALYYDGNLNVTNTGAAPLSGNSYKFFTAPSFGGTFSSTTFPSLPGGLSWVDHLAASGSISVSGSSGSPVLSLSKSGVLLTLSWDSTTFPGYRVQAQTNSSGIGTNWSATSSSNVSPFTIPINPANRAVFFRLSNP